MKKSFVPIRNRRAVSRLLAAAFAATTLAGGTGRAEYVHVADLKAVVRTLGFLDHVVADGEVLVAVVYAGDGKQEALQTAQAFNAIAGPANLRVQTLVVAASDLGQAGGRIDAAYLMPSAFSQTPTVSAAALKRRFVTISSEPSCIDAKACVLMVRSADRVRIVLNTQGSAAVGADFSPVFLMMVERR